MLRIGPSKPTPGHADLTFDGQRRIGAHTVPDGRFEEVHQRLHIALRIGGMDGGEELVERAPGGGRVYDLRLIPSPIGTEPAFERSGLHHRVRAFCREGRTQNGTFYARGLLQLLTLGEIGHPRRDLANVRPATARGGRAPVPADHAQHILPQHRELAHRDARRDHSVRRGRLDRDIVESKLHIYCPRKELRIAHAFLLAVPQGALHSVSCRLLSALVQKRPRKIRAGAYQGLGWPGHLAFGAGVINSPSQIFVLFSG